ncbi:MAG: GYF domain-containing protein [Deltaproteobacteria bacterium]|nr:GYF domain-containing protein [Deltaproteobacteria bacterium]
MKFRCESCGQKYSLPDERVAGKTLKIRCRKCGQTLRITGKPLAAPAPTLEEEQEATRAMPASQLKAALSQTRESSGVVRGLAPEGTRRASGTEPGGAATPPPPPASALEASSVEAPAEAWFAVISGKQEGPMDLAALRAAVVAGRIGRKTYVWSEEIDDWRPIASVPRLRPLLDEVEPPPPPAGPHVAAGTLQMRSEEIAAAEADARAKASGLPEGADASLAAAIEQATEAALAGGLDEAPEGDPSEGPWAETEAESEDIPISSFEDSIPPGQDAIGEALEEEEEVDPFAAVPDGPEVKEPRETTEMFILASGVNKRRSPIRIAAALLALVGFLGGMGYLLTLGGVDLKGLVPGRSKSEDRGTREAGPVDEERAQRIREQMLGADKPPPAETSTGGALRITARRPKEAADPVGDEPVKEKEERKVEELSAADKAAVAALYGERKTQVQIKVKAKDSKEGVDSVESPIEPEVVARKIGESSKAFQSCVQQELRRNPGFAGGRVTLTVTVLPSGIVSSAAISDKSIHVSDVGVCIRRSIKRAVFPSYGGDGPVDFEVPLVLSTGY